MSSSESPTSMEPVNKEKYRDAFIAMTFFAILFFIILVVIVVLWCKKRRQTEVKTVVIQPKRRPISTKKPEPQTNGGSQHINGSVDVEAGEVINTDEIELSDESEESKPQQATPDPQASSEPTPVSEVNANTDAANQNSPAADSANHSLPAGDTSVSVETTPSNEQRTDSSDTQALSAEWQVVDKGETNPSFEKGDE